MKLRTPSTRSPRSKSATKPSRNGFSLIEVMIAVAVMGLVTYGIVTFIRNMGSQSAAVSSKNDMNTLTNELQSLFNNAGTCMEAFTANGPNFKINNDVNKTDKAQKIKLQVAKGPPPVIYHGDSYVHGKGLTIVGLDIISKNLVVDRQYKVEVRLSTDRRLRKADGTKANDPTQGGDLLRPHIFTLLVYEDAAGVLTKCAGQYDNLWKKGTKGLGTPAENDIPIYYDQGYVGVGLGKSEPMTALDVKGTAQADAFMYKSDLRQKKNVREIPSSLDRVLKLHGVLFDWKGDGPRDQLGFLAQEVETVFPEAVVTHDNGMKAVAYGNLVAPLIEAMKQQQELLEQQRREIDELKRKLGK